VIEDQLEAKVPQIPWRRAIMVSLPAGARCLGCRFCIALLGLKPEHVPSLPQSFEEFTAHMRTTHGREALPPIEDGKVAHVQAGHITIVTPS